MILKRTSAMGICNRLHIHIGNPLEWTSAKKANLILWIYFFQQCFYWLLLSELVDAPAWQGYIEPQQAHYHLQNFSGLVGLSLAIIGLAYGAQLRWKNSSFYEHLAAQYFGVSHVYYGYCIGLMSLPVGVVLAGAPVVGFIFFHRIAVAAAFVTSLSLVVGISVATIQGSLSYAPIAQNLYSEQGQLSTAWLMAYGFFAAPHLLVLFGLAFYVLQRWRIREQQVDYLSRTDSLTDLMNRRSIMQQLQHEKEQCDKNDGLLSVVMVDLDHFKSINDQWGHCVGDEVLVLTANTLKNALRQNDYVGRYGGEEFLLVLPGLEPEQAACLAERIRATLAALVITLPEGQKLTLSASLGMSFYSVERNVTVDDLVKQADFALYKAKNSGRDQLVVAA